MQIPPQTPEILVVDDDPASQRYMEIQLARLGYSSDTVSNGRAALNALELEIYALVLLDCRLPDMNCIEFVQAVRTQGTEQCFSIAIVAVTADPINFPRDLCIECGMNDWLSKPYRPEQLSQIISSWIG